MNNVHPVFASMLRTIAGVAPDAKLHNQAEPTPPANAGIARIRQLEAENAELQRKLAFQKEATAQLAAQLEELCPHTTTAEMPDGSEVPAPAEVVSAARVWLRDTHDLEFYARIDEQTLLHFEVEKAEARIAAREDRQS